jgi:hypothetical protein
MKEALHAHVIPREIPIYVALDVVLMFFCDMVLLLYFYF